MSLGIERSFSSAPTMDTARRVPFSLARDWTPSGIEIFGHTISIDIPTGNLVVSTSDVAYPYYNFSLGISRKYDAQEQHMQLSYLRSYPNVNPKPHWFGNWQFAYEADVDEVWHSSYPELHVTSGVGANGLFEIKEPDFRRNQRDCNSVNESLKAYGIPGRTLAALDWNFHDNDFLLRTRRGVFQIITGHFNEETLVDDICADMWLFNPISGSGFRISSKYFFNLRNGRNRDVGFPLLVSKLVDALGHAIELKPSTGQKPFKEYILADGSGRTFQFNLTEELTFLDGLSPGGHVRKHLVSEVIDGTKPAHNKHNKFGYQYKQEFLPDNSALLLLEKVDLPSEPGGRRIRYHYDDLKYPGILNAIENSFGAKIRFEYVEDPTDNDERLNPRRKIKKIIDPEGITFDYEYDHPNSTVYVTVSSTENGEPDRRIKYQYVRDLQNTKQRYITLTEVEVRRGYVPDSPVVERQANDPQRVTNRTEYTKDGRFNVEKEFDPLGRLTRNKFNDFNQLESAWDFDNHWTQYTYDIPAKPSALDPRRYDLRFTTRENVFHVIDESSQERSFIVPDPIRTITKEYTYHKYNAISPVDTTGDPAHSTHRVHTEKDERGKVRTYTYTDATNNSPLSPTLVESPKGYKTEYLYNDRGERETVTDAEGNKHTYVYNSQGQIESYKDPNGNSISLRCYEDGNWLHTFIDQLEKITTFHRDVDGRIEKITDPVGDSVNYEYYKNGRLYKIIHHRPKVQQDPIDPAAWTADYPALETEFQYTPLGSLACLINPKGLKLILEYDEAGRLYQWYHDVDNFKETKYLYDVAGQLERLVDRKGNSTEYTYHNSGLVRTIRYPDWQYPDLNDGSPHNIRGKQVEYKEYDYLGRVLEVVDSEIQGSTEFSYDEAGNLVLRRDPADPDTDRFELNFLYDDDNRLEKIWDSKKEYELVLTLDSLGRPETLQDSSLFDESISWVYTYRKQVGQETKVLNLFSRSSVATGLISKFDYDEKNRLKDIVYTWNGPSPIFSQGFLYRDDDLIKEITGDHKNSFQYDGIKQLIFEETGNFSSDYDEAGNRLYRVNRAGDPSPASNKYNDLNQLKNIPGNPASFEYDDNGNMLTSPMAGGLAEYYFDGTDRLRVIRTDQYEITYLYDQQGRLVERRIISYTSTRSSNITQFRYLFSKPIVVRRNDQPFSILTWDTKGILLRIRRQQKIGATSYQHSLFPIYDGLRDVIKLVDGDKNIRVELTCDPWGEATINDRNGLFEFWGYRGGLLDIESRNVLFGARWYSPEIGRWLSEDPSNHDDAKAHQDTVNLYVYAQNSPIAFIDPSGLETTPKTTEESVNLNLGLLGRGLDVGDIIIDALKNGIPGSRAAGLSVGGLLFGALSFASLSNVKGAETIGNIGAIGNVALSAISVIAGGGGILAVGSVGLGAGQLTYSVIKRTYLGGQLGVDTADLYEHLRSGQLGVDAADVYEYLRSGQFGIDLADRIGENE